jgi:hypothetical protein
MPISIKYIAFYRTVCAQIALHLSADTASAQYVCQQDMHVRQTCAVAHWRWEEFHFYDNVDVWELELGTE